MFAILIPMLLFSIYIMPQIDVSSGPLQPVLSLSEFIEFLQTEMTDNFAGFLFIVALIMLFLSTPALFITLSLVLPIFAALRHFNLYNSPSILVSTFVGGWFAGHILLMFMGADRDSFRVVDYQTFILPLSICSLLGGIIFCRMTIWRKAKLVQPTDGMG